MKIMEEVEDRVCREIMEMVARLGRVITTQEIFMKKIGRKRLLIPNITSKIILGFQDLNLILKGWEKGIPSIRKVNLFMRSSLIQFNLPKIGANHSENSSRSIPMKEMAGTGIHKSNCAGTKISNISDGIEREADRHRQPSPYYYFYYQANLSSSQLKNQIKSSSSSVAHH
jgi:hypothetical protein